MALYPYVIPPSLMISFRQVLEGARLDVLPLDRGPSLPWKQTDLDGCVIHEHGAMVVLVIHRFSEDAAKRLAGVEGRLAFLMYPRNQSRTARRRLDRYVERLLFANGLVGTPRSFVKLYRIEKNFETTMRLLETQGFITVSESVDGREAEREITPLGGFRASGMRILVGKASDRTAYVALIRRWIVLRRGRVRRLTERIAGATARIGSEEG